MLDLITRGVILLVWAGIIWLLVIDPIRVRRQRVKARAAKARAVRCERQVGPFTWEVDPEPARRAYREARDYYGQGRR